MTPMLWVTEHPGHKGCDKDRCDEYARWEIRCRDNTRHACSKHLAPLCKELLAQPSRFACCGELVPHHRPGCKP